MKTVRRSFKTGCMLAAGWCVLASQSARAQVLDQVPSDALVVLKLNHVSEINTKLSDLMTQLGLTDIIPQTKDPLGTIETQLGLGAGLDPKRDAAAVLLNTDFQNDGPPPMLVLLPVSDYKAFLGTLTVVRTEGDVSVVHFKENEEDAFVENWGDYAALSPKKEGVTGKHEGIKPTGVAVHQLETQDVCVYANIPALKALALPKLDEGQKAAMDELEKNTKNLDETKKNLAKKALSEGIKGATEFLNDCQSVTMGISLSKAGINGNFMVDFAPDTYMGKLASQLKNTEEPLMGGLPKGTYITYGGSIQDPKAATQLLDDMLNPMLDDLNAFGDDGKKFVEVLKVIKEAMGSIEGGSYGTLAPTAALGAGSLIKQVYVYKGDADKLKAVPPKFGDMVNDLVKMFAGGEDMTKTTVTPGFKTIAGVKFDRVLIEINPDNTSQEAMQAAEALSRTFGPDGLSIIDGEVDPKTIVIALGLDDDFLGQVVEAAKENKDVLTDDVKSVDSQLPKKRALVGYLALDEYIRTLLSYARANGMNLPVQLPNSLPPIAVNAGSDGSAIQYNLFLPTKLTQSLVQAGLAVYAQFNGHPGGGL